MPKIKFVRENKEFEVPAGANLRRAAIDAGIQIYKGPERFLNCRGLGLCGTCAVLLENGTTANVKPMGLREKIRLNLSMKYIGNEAKMRLACRTELNGDIEVTTQPPMNLYGQGASGYTPDPVNIKGPWHKKPEEWPRPPAGPPATPETSATTGSA